MMIAIIIQLLLCPGLYMFLSHLVFSTPLRDSYFSCEIGPQFFTVSVVYKDLMGRSGDRVHFYLLDFRLCNCFGQ